MYQVTVQPLASEADGLIEQQNSNLNWAIPMSRMEQWVRSWRARINLAPTQDVK